MAETVAAELALGEAAEKKAAEIKAAANAAASAAASAATQLQADQTKADQAAQLSSRKQDRAAARASAKEAKEAAKLEKRWLGKQVVVSDKASPYAGKMGLVLSCAVRAGEHTAIPEPCLEQIRVAAEVFSVFRVMCRDLGTV